MKQINFDIEPASNGNYEFNDKSALALLYLLLRRADNGESVAKNMDQKSMSVILGNMIQTLMNMEIKYDNSKELIGLLNKLFEKTSSGGKKRRSIKKKRQPKKNITIKKKYKKNKKLPKKKIKRKQTIHKKRRNKKNKTLRRRK